MVRNVNKARGFADAQRMYYRYLNIVLTSSAAGIGDEGVKFHPLTDPGGSFLIRAIKYYNFSLPKFNENVQFTCL